MPGFNALNMGLNRLCARDGYKGDFWRHAKAHWNDRATKSTRDDQVTLFSDVTIGVAVAKARRNDGRPTEEPDLPTMGMTAQH